MRKSIKKAIVGVLSAAMAFSVAAVPAQNASAIVEGQLVSTTKSSSYRAYIVVQQAGTYVFRDHWYGNNNHLNSLELNSTTYSIADGNGGVKSNQPCPYSPLLYLHHSDLTNTVTNAILLKGPGTRVDITDAVITKPGTYSVRIDLPEAASKVFTYADADFNTPEQDITCKETKSFFNMIGIATDIPRPDPKGLAAVPTLGTANFTNVELYFDGKLVKKVDKCSTEDGTFANDDAVKYNDRGQIATGYSSGNYYTPMLINTYDSENNEQSRVRVAKSNANDANIPDIKTVPTKSIEIRFTIDGDIFDANGAASDSIAALKMAIANAKAIDPAYQNTVNIGTTVNADGSFNSTVQTYDDNLNPVSAKTINYNPDGTVSGSAVAQIVATKNEGNKASFTPDAVGTTFTINGNTYKVTKAATVSEDKTKITGSGEVALTAVTNAAKVNSGAVVENGYFAYNVTTINAKAFSKAKKATTVIVGAKVTTIGNNAFAGLKKLKNIQIKSKVLKKITGKKTFKFKKAVTIKVPKAKKAAYTKLIKKAGGAKNKIK